MSTPAITYLDVALPGGARAQAWVSLNAIVALVNSDYLIANRHTVRLAELKDITAVLRQVCRGQENHIMIDEAELTRIETRADRNPLPTDLGRHLADYIEPATMNMHLDHADVMDVIAIVYPEIRDYFRNHPEALA